VQPVAETIDGIEGRPLTTGQSLTLPCEALPIGSSGPSRRRRTRRTSRFTEARIIAVLKEHQAGLPAAELRRKPGISDATFSTWRSKYGGLEVLDAKRLQVLEAWADRGRRPRKPIKNRKLKKLLAEPMLDAATRREMLAKNVGRPARGGTP
jgi:putative transposase